MTNTVWVAILIAGILMSYWVGRRESRDRYWIAGQVAMKEKIRRELNQNITLKKLSVHFQDGQEMTAEQTLEFMCYGRQPDPNDVSRGVATYTPH